MAAYVKVAGSREAIAEGMNLGTDQWAIALTNTAPSLAFTAGTSDLATGNGYTAGGANVATTTHAESAGVYRLIVADPATWTASGAGIGPLRYAMLVNKTTNQCIGYWDYGSSITLSGTNGDTCTVDCDGTNGVVQVA